MGSLSIAPNSFTPCANMTIDPLQLLMRNPLHAPETLTVLHDEINRIHASKLHIPFTKALLTQAIKVVNEELDRYERTKPVLQQFMPMTESCGEKVSGIGRTDRKSLNQHSLKTNFNRNSLTLHLNNYKEMEDQTKLLASDSQSQSGKSGGIRLSKGCITNQSALVGKEDFDGLLVPDLSLSTPEIKNSRMGINAIASKPHCNRSGSSSVSNVQLNFKTEQQESGRKPRRCWSQELHQRFVRALEQLGGPHAATPKQIRERMQVDGLTNDEVKSHLQKFRLHMRRAATTGSASHCVGLRMPQESLKQCDSQSNSPNGPLQFGGEQDADAEGEGEFLIINKLTSLDSTHIQLIFGECD